MICKWFADESHLYIRGIAIPIAELSTAIIREQYKVTISAHETYTHTGNIGLVAVCEDHHPTRIWAA